MEGRGSGKGRGGGGGERFSAVAPLLVTLLSFQESAITEREVNVFINMIHSSPLNPLFVSVLGWVNLGESDVGSRRRPATGPKARRSWRARRNGPRLLRVPKRGQGGKAIVPVPCVHSGFAFLTTTPSSSARPPHGRVHLQGPRCRRQPVLARGEWRGGGGGLWCPVRQPQASAERPPRGAAPEPRQPFARQSLLLKNPENRRLLIDIRAAKRDEVIANVRARSRVGSGSAGPHTTELLVTYIPQPRTRLYRWPCSRPRSLLSKGATAAQARTSRPQRSRQRGRWTRATLISAAARCSEVPSCRSMTSFLS